MPVCFLHDLALDDAPRGRHLAGVPAVPIAINEEWLQAATVDEILSWVAAWRERRLWPEEER